MAATTIAEKIAEIERKQNFTSDWFEESLQEMADFVKARYRSIENNNIALVKTCDMFRAENAKLKERINEMVDSRREFLDV
jgi:DNA anti-recombination protein RmuC